MKNTIIVILSLLVIGLGSYVFFDKFINDDKTIINNEENKTETTENNDSQEKKENDIYTYKSISGKFSLGEKELETLDNGEVITGNAFLYLKENGTFVYDKGNTYTHCGYIGNYIIIDNKIYLNYWLGFGGDNSLEVHKGSRVIEIENSNVLIDDNAETGGITGDFRGKLNRINENVDSYDWMLDLSKWYIESEYKYNS